MGKRAPSRRTFWLAALCLVGLAGCAETPAAPEAPPPKVTVQRPEPRELVDYDKYNGWTRASETVEVRSRVRGHIKKVDFVDGELVKKGDLLFQLDPRPFEADLERAKKALEVDVAQSEFATAEAKRDQELFEKKAIAKTEYERSMAQKRTWEAKVDQAKEEVRRAELDVEYSRITADISGRISRAQLTVGNLVNAGGSDPLLTTIVSIDPIYVYFPVDERALLKYRESRAKRKPDDAASEKPKPADADEESDEPEKKEDAKPAKDAEPATRLEPPVREAKIPFEFGLETEKGYPHKGVIDFADNRIDAGTGTIEVRGVAENHDNVFVAGSRVRVQVPVSDAYRALVIPDVAVLSDQDQRYLLVLNDENVVVRRTVTLGRLLPDGMRVILPASGKEEPLTAQDLVIVNGLQRARINYPVEPLDADGKAVSRAKK